MSDQCDMGYELTGVLTCGICKVRPSNFKVYTYETGVQILTPVCVGCYVESLRSIEGFKKFQRKPVQAVQMELQWDLPNELG